MPTGIALHDPRTRLLEAGERVLLRSGPAGLTSRALTDEAGVAKGVLHRHFDDLDDFLVGLVRKRAAAVGSVLSGLADEAGRGTVSGNLTAALIGVFTPLFLATVRLVLTRDELRARLRGNESDGLPLLAEAVRGVGAYLAAEQRLGRILPSAAPDMLAHALIGTGHLLFAGELGGLPDESGVYEVVEAIIVGAEPGASR